MISTWFLFCTFFSSISITKSIIPHLKQKAQHTLDFFDKLWPPRKAACFLWDKIVGFARNIVIEKITVYVFMYLAVSVLLTAIDGYDELIECNMEAS